MASNFESLSVNITKLESRGLALKESLSLVQEVVNDIEGSKCKEAITKIKNVLNKNKGYSEILNINNLINGTEGDVSSIEALSLDEILLFKNAPITSVEVERMFSEYKCILAENRRSFRFHNLRHHVITKCNHFL